MQKQSTKEPTQSIRFHPEVHKRLLELKEQQDRSINWLVNDILKKYFGIEDQSSSKQQE